MGFGIIAAIRGVPKKHELEPVAAVDTVNKEQYMQLARKVGFDYAFRSINRAEGKVRSAALRRFLSENGITVYDEKAVERYMRSITPAGRLWGWTWLQAYNRAIPAEVLMAMGRIKEAFPDTGFQITDFNAKDPDPFLRCGIPDADEWFIIERWDEPGFRQ